MALIHIANWSQPVKARRGHILEAALDAGVPFPHGCACGECGGCKSQLLEGEVTLDRYNPDALSKDERAQGLILACRARPLGDVRVRWLSTAVATPMVKLNMRVFSVEHVAHDVIVLTLSLPEGKDFDFRPGQFAKLRFGRLPLRCYSMANQPGQGQVVFHIRIVPQGLVSQCVATQIQTGDRVELRGPFGDAYWEGVEHSLCAAGPLLLLAGGTGLAPMLSVLDAALRDGYAPEQIHFYHGVRSEGDLYAGDMLQRRAREHGFRFVPVYSQHSAAGERSGHLHEAMAQDFSSLHTALIYVAGPPVMVDAVQHLAAQRGAPAERVRADPFFAAESGKRSLWGRISKWLDF